MTKKKKFVVLEDEIFIPLPWLSESSEGRTVPKFEELLPLDMANTKKEARITQAKPTGGKKVTKAKRKMLEQVREALNIEEDAEVLAQARMGRLSVQPVQGGPVRLPRQSPSAEERNVQQLRNEIIVLRRYIVELERKLSKGG